MVRRLVAIVLLVAALAYLADYFSLRYGIPGGRPQFGTVTVQRSYAVRLKNKKTEYMFDAPREEPCVHSVFPQLGAAPCWYLERHRQQQVDME
jgi:hypothetical protein